MEQVDEAQEDMTHMARPTTRTIMRRLVPLKVDFDILDRDILDLGMIFDINTQKKDIYSKIIYFNFKNAVE